MNAFSGDSPIVTASATKALERNTRENDLPADGAAIPSASRQTYFGAFMATAQRALGVPAYDPRWEKLQRDYQTKMVTRYLAQNGWASVVFIGFVNFASGIHEQSWLMNAGCLISALSLAFAFVFMPSLSAGSDELSGHRHDTSVAAVSLLGLALGWMCFGYASMVYLPEQWHGIAVGAIVGVIALGGIGGSPYPLLSLIFMIIIASGGVLGVLVSENALTAYYVGAYILLILMLYAQFLLRSCEALKHVRDTAELEASEAEKRQAIQSQHEAERALLNVREQGRMRDEERRVRKNEARKRELLELAAQFEATIGEVSETVASAAHSFNITARDMSCEATEALDQIEHIAKAIEQVAQGSTAAAAASDQFAISIDSVSGQAADAAQLARFTNETATATDATVTLLTERAEGIGEIAELINSIAGRTRLLAVNASIEAARGGEAGRGFAVVASEVKELANQTHHATGDVSSSIKEMQQGTKASAIELAEIREQIGVLETAATSIASAMNQQSYASKSLAESIDLAAAGVAGVSATTQELRKTANTVGEACGQLLSASNDLEVQSDLLKEKVANFLEQIRRD
ncbi:methyl-accepting chemotaxis protein [uncultured Erythrobacter sp.]|uniref:methyl-accepting chemotaxis protein n=1 Tax=uncultured Erythrobacter sp. TaxID=263913 RepID=UPI0026397863|nr:methyl-accepting chemotaxis protein [uncultured Erythrobacter sp.]